MSWNHRVIKQRCTVSLEPIYGIHEVYYARDGSPEGYTDAVSVTGTKRKELRWTLKMMKRALKKPVLTPEDFKSE